jgi:YD repeat-containing protein
MTSEAIAATTGDPLPTVSYGYDPNAGLQTGQSSSDGKTITTAFDSLGRVTSYTDADGNISTYTYDIDGRQKPLNDGKGSQTSSYDATTGDLTSLADSAAGNFTATYNADGQMTQESYPNGIGRQLHLQRSR